MSDYHGAEIMMDFMNQWKEKKKENEMMRQEAALRKIEQLQNKDWYKGEDAKQGVFDKLLDKLGYQTKDTRTVRANNDIAALEDIAYGYEDNPRLNDFSSITQEDKRTSDAVSRFFGMEDDTRTTSQYNQDMEAKYKQQADEATQSWEESKARQAASEAARNYVVETDDRTKRRRKNKIEYRNGQAW